MNASTDSPLAIVLAAGKGTRMQSDLPKVLCTVLGRPMIDYVLDAITEAGIRRVLVVVGYGAEQVRSALSGRDGVEFIQQSQQLGTGHAVAVCRDALAAHQGPVLIVAGDSPLMQSRSLARLLDDFQKRDAACLLGTLHKKHPHGLGRVVRDADGRFSAIVEEKDATPQQRALTEVNMSTYLFSGRDLLHALEKMSNQNTQGEYYLTDCPGILKKEGKTVEALAVLDPCESLSINDVDELKTVEAEMRKMGY